MSIRLLDLLVAKSLQFLGHFAFDELLSHGLFGAGMGIQRDDDVVWVVTVPAIWSDIGQVVYAQGGLFGRTQSGLEGSRHGLFQEISVFMVVDCGGGTDDITCYKVASKDPLVMDGFCQPTGVACGVACSWTASLNSFFKHLFGTNTYLGLVHNWPLEVEEVKEVPSTHDAIIQSQ
jgi:hypothetical protein